jgi:hypothetical protein
LDRNRDRLSKHVYRVPSSKDGSLRSHPDSECAQGVSMISASVQNNRHRLGRRRVTGFEAPANRKPPPYLPNFSNLLSSRRFQSSLWPTTAATGILIDNPIAFIAKVQAVYLETHVEMCRCLDMLFLNLAAWNRRRPVHPTPARASSTGILNQSPTLLGIFAWNDKNGGEHLF